MTNTQKQFKRKLVGFGGFLGFIVFATLCFGTFKVIAQTIETPEHVAQSSLGENEIVESKITDPGVIKYAFLSAAIAVSLGAIGAGAAVGYVGAAAMGAIGEKPELAVRAILFVALAEGIAVFPLVVAIFILTKI